VLGALLFAAYRLLRPAVAPEVARRIDVDPALLDRLGEGFRRAWKRDPTRDELAEMVLDHADDEVLYREALALGLDRDDPAVRRRLIEKLTVMRHGAVAEPTDAALARWFAEHRHHFHEEGRTWFRQVFLDPGRRRGAVSEDARTALAALTGGADPAALGDPSPLPAEADGLPDVQVGHLYGKGFLDSLVALPAGAWQGPLSSTKGVHLVRVTRRQPPRDPELADVRAAVRADWITARSKGYLDAAAGLLPRYRIRIAPAARQKLEGAGLLGPLLEAGR
jgi:hypothetical protein